MLPCQVLRACQEGVMNKFGSEGPFQLTKPSSLKSIESGMTILFVRMNGGPAKQSDFGIHSEWMIFQSETVEAISTAVAKLITKRLAIPNECLSLVWSRPQDQHVILTIVLTPLSQEDWEMLSEEARMKQNPGCIVCSQPCHDADDDDSRELNCVACTPCFLCDRCRVITTNGEPLCYLCLGPQDRSFLEETHSNHMLRLRVLAPRIFEKTGGTS